MSEERILAALQTLSESDRERQAPPEVETRLLAAFRQSRATRFRRKAVVWATAAAMLIGVVALNNARLRKLPPDQSVQSAGYVLNTPAPPIDIAPTARAPVPIERVRKTAGQNPARTRRVEPQEMLTDFFPLVDVAPAFGRGTLVRMTVPAAAMQTVGLPVREDRLGEPIQADVLIGEEGLPRAIRFVSYAY
jgi:hypothetical protein